MLDLYHTRPSTSPLISDLPGTRNYAISRGKYRDIPDNSIAGMAGLENLGNTCFINAALQCILNAQPLTEYFLSGSYKKDINFNSEFGTEGKFADAYAELIQDQWNSRSPYLKPRKLVNLIWKYAHLFHPGAQHDSQEFLAFFLDKLHEDLNQAHKQAKSPYPKSRKKTNEILAAIAWREYLKKNCSKIVDLFQGQLLSTLKCLTCKHISRTFETFMYLSVPIPKTKSGNPSLQDCIREFTKEETLDGPEKWNCPKCKSPQKAIKKFDIWKVPPLLIVHIKRFSYSYITSRIRTQVDYPISDLNLSDFIASPQKDPPIYELFAKTKHIGSLDAGHYIAIIKNRETQQWIVFDDDKVFRLGNQDLISPESYVLFYQKAAGEFHKQATDRPEFWPHVLSASGSLQQSEVSIVFEEDSRGSDSFYITTHMKTGSGMDISLLSNSELKENRSSSSIDLHTKRRERLSTETRETAEEFRELLNEARVGYTRSSSSNQAGASEVANDIIN